MGKLFYIMGKSATGKDLVFRETAADPELKLKKLVPYTTRPIREKETDGVEYHFVTDAKAEELMRAGKVIELRAYRTVHGIWRYFTVDDGQTDLLHNNYAAIGTLESYGKLKSYYGADRVIPIYIEVEDGLRLERALKREQKPQNRRYEEMCRRFLADAADFSEENLKKAGVTKRFSNNGDPEDCIREVADYIRKLS